MKSFDDIERMVQKSRIMASRTTDERILRSAQSAFRPAERMSSPSTAAPAAKTQGFGARRALKIAAVLLIGIGLLSLLLPNGNSLVPESIAMADVQRAVEQQNGVQVWGTRRCSFPASESSAEQVYTYLTEKQASDAGYIDTTYEQDGQPVLQVCYHFESGTVTVVYHFLSQYYRFQVPEFYRDGLRGLTLLGLLELLFQSGDTTRVGPEIIHGTQAVGFEVADIDRRLDESLGPKWIRRFFVNLKQSRAQLWVDPESKLPVQMRGDFLLEKCLFSDFTTMQMEETNDQWQWGLSIDEPDLFPEIPEGYQQVIIPNNP